LKFLNKDQQSAVVDRIKPKVKEVESDSADDDDDVE